MQTDNRTPAFDQNRKVFGLVIIAVIILMIGLIAYLQARLKRNASVGGTSKQLLTQMVFPTSTAPGSSASANNPAPSATSAPAAPAGPTATVQPAAAFVPPARPASYTLQKGEFPVCIARRYDLDLKQFLTLNHLTINSKSAPGQKLQLPEAGKWNPSNGPRALRKHPAQHKVASGESLASIACYYGDVYPEAILQANSLSGANQISAGKTINIP